MTRTRSWSHAGTIKPERRIVDVQQQHIAHSARRTSARVFQSPRPVVESDGNKELTSKLTGLQLLVTDGPSSLFYEVDRRLGREFCASSFREKVCDGNLQAAVRQLRSLSESIGRFERPSARGTSGRIQLTADTSLRVEASPLTAQALQGTHQEFFRLCLQRGRLDNALELARLLPPNPLLFTPLLKECVDHGDLYAVMKAVEVRKEMGIPEDAFCYTALLKAATREGNPAKVDAIFEQAWARGIHDPSIFNAIISQHNAKQDTKAAFAVFERMLERRVDPDAVTMNLLIEAAGNGGRLDKVEELYSQMQVLGPRPTSHTFVHLFSAFKRGREKNPDWIFQVFEDMVASGLVPITQHFVTFLGACSETTLTAQQIQQTVASALAFCAASGGDCSVYAALLKFSVAQGIPQNAFDVWKTIKKGGHRLDSWVFTALFTACALNICPEMRVVVTEASSQLDRQWQALRRRGPAAVRQAQQGMTFSYNALLNAFAKMGMMAAAREVFMGMQETGPQLDIVTYNTMLAGYAQAGDTENAFAVFHELCEMSSSPSVSGFKLRPTLRTFGSLLHACARSGNADSAKRVMSLVRCAGFSPSAEIYTSLMHACVKQGSEGNIDYAFEVFAQMKAEGVQPTAVTYGCLMNACESAGRIEGAMALYQEACDSSITPTDECHNILINLFAKSGRLEEALGLFKRMGRSKGFRFQAGALNSLIRALAPEHVHRALRLLSFVRTSGLRVHRETLVALISACAETFLIDEAHSLYWELRGERTRTTLGSTQECGSHLIMALCTAGQERRALKVYEDMVVAERSDSAASEPRSHVLAAGKQPSVTELDGKGRAVQSSTLSSVHPDNLSAAELLGLRRKVLWKDAKPRGKDRGTAAESPKSLAVKVPPRRRRAVFPQARAMAALVQAFAAKEDLTTAFMLYRELQRDSVGAAAVTLSNRYMWQALIEVSCRKQQLPRALQVFDDWKAYCATQTAMHRFDEDASSYLPRLSNCTLAFLESCCRADPEHEWRVYDVCAAMRQQEERRSQAALPRPRKRSHHFAEALG